MRKIFGVDRNIFFLGLTSFFTDLSSEMIYPLLPIFLTSVLGAGLVFVGLVEGIAESTSSLLKVFSGYFSDKFNARKSIAVFGYSISSLAKPILSIVAFPWQVLALRFTDRLGKGIRTAPRDAMIADIASANDRGKSFGFHRMLDTLGAVGGPLLAFLLLPLLWGNYRLLFLTTAIPAFLAVLILIFFVSEKKKAVAVKTAIPFEFRALDKNFLLFILVIFIFTLGNSSDAFLLLRAQNLGVPIFLLPIIWMTFNIIYALSATPGGSLSDRFGRKRIIVLGMIVYSLVYFGFAFAQSAWQAWLLFACYGLYYGCTDGVSRALVADFVPSEQRATAYGVYNAALGLAAFPASLLMGILWQRFGVVVAFSFGASLALASALLFALLLKK